MSDDIARIAAQLTGYLAPFSPWLVKFGESAADRAGSAAWEGFKSIWTLLRPTVAADSRATEALVELSAAPEDDDLHAQLRVQLRRLLSEDSELASSLVGLLETVPQQKMSVTGIVNRGDVHGGWQAGIIGDVHQGDRRGPDH